MDEDLADLFDSAPCGYVSLLPDRRICRINGTLAGWVGREPGELLDRPIYELVGFGGRIAFETHLAPLLRMQDHVFEVALDLLAADGTKIPVIANAAEKRDSAGNHLFTRMTMFKAVDRRTYERTLLDAQKRAEAEAKAEREVALLREQFIAVLGHDLRNPLAAIAAGIRMVEKRGDLTDRQQLVLGEMQESADRAMALVEDMLDLARLRSSGLAVDRRMADVGHVIEQTVGEIRSIYPGHEVRCTIEVPDRVFCDPARIAQLVSNLLTNAAKHGSPDQPIRLEAKAENDCLQVAVINGGDPVPPHVLEHLFEPFFRGAARPSRSGLGLGLFIAGEVAKAHGGTIDVSSTEAETRFTFRMPLVEPEHPVSESPAISG